MGVTYGYLARGSDVLLKFNSIDKFPSLLTNLSALDKMNIPGQAHPTIFDNGNVDGDITLDVNLISSTYNSSEDWGSTGTIFDQFFEMRRVFYNSGKFLTGSKPTKQSGSKDYNSTSNYSVFSLVIFFQAGDDDAFSSSISLFEGDYIREDKTGIVVPVIPVSISLKNTNQINTCGVASLKFALARSVISFRT